MDRDVGQRQAGHRARPDILTSAGVASGVAWHEPIIEGAPGTVKGTTPACRRIAAALAVKKVMGSSTCGHTKAVARRAEELLGTKAYTSAPACSRTSTSASSRVGAQMNVGWGDAAAAAWSRSMTQGRARRRRAVARAIGPRRRRTDGHRLELSPRAPAPGAFALCDPQRRRSTSCRPTSVWYFRETSYEEIKKLWTSAPRWRGRDDDDGHGSIDEGAWPPGRTLQQDRGRNDAREHREGGAADLERRIRPGQSRAARDERVPDRPRHQSARCAA
jgi:hypothetical protein